ncbi:MAG: LacI family DNA-binding transcriptional regulator [Anaerolineae bacterium]|nr:LacI family DNA-binding transcriptional regulator [Anaerolineae bacterium]
MKDIARHAGVGTTTVSRVLHNHPYVSEEKRQRVLEAIEELQYRPNYNARWLRGQRSGLIGFVTDEVAITPFAVDIIRGVQEVALEYDHVLIMMNTGPDLASTQAAVEFLLERQVVGIIYAAMFHREVQLPKNIYNVPAALANCYVGDRSLPSAVPDEFSGGYHAVRALLEAGHRRIAFLNVKPPAIDAAEGRLAGYKAALAEFDVPFDSTLIIPATEDAPINYAITRKLLERPDPPTAFFAGNDRTAMGCYAAIKDAGLRIPEDVGIVGFDNQVSIAGNLIPALTTMQLPHYEMGQWALRTLLEEPADEPLQHKIDCPLIRRVSV